MDINSVLAILLPIVGIIALIALAWFAIELALTVKKARQTVENINEKVSPTLDSVARITESLEPAMKKIDPLVDRVALTVDAANLEMIRVDSILENVDGITQSVSSATSAVETIANAPVNAAASLSSKVRGLFKPKTASKETEQLAKGKSVGTITDGSAAKKKAPVEELPESERYVTAKKGPEGDAVANAQQKRVDVPQPPVAQPPIPNSAAVNSASAPTQPQK